MTRIKVTNEKDERLKKARRIITRLLRQAEIVSATHSEDGDTQDAKEEAREFLRGKWGR